MQRLGLILLDVLEPFSPFAAQILWVLQPTLGLMIDRERIDTWARLLEDPQGIEQLRRELEEHHVRH
jgi:hypothetical protein